jgi:hypothetical protein
MLSRSAVATTSTTRVRLIPNREMKVKNFRRASTFMASFT